MWNKQKRKNGGSFGKGGSNMLFGVKSQGTITVQTGRPKNTLGYNGHPNQNYVINYSVNSINQHRLQSLVLRVLGR